CARRALALGRTSRRAQLANTLGNELPSARIEEDGVVRGARKDDVLAELRARGGFDAAIAASFDRQLGDVPPTFVARAEQGEDGRAKLQVSSRLTRHEPAEPRTAKRCRERHRLRDPRVQAAALHVVADDQTAQAVPDEVEGPRARRALDHLLQPRPELQDTGTQTVAERR